MIKIFLLIIFSFLLANCSLNENSKIWNQKNSISNEGKNLQIVLDEKKEITKMINKPNNIKFEETDRI